MKQTFEDLIALCKLRKTTPKIDSRDINPGDTFIALAGETQNGVNFIPDAIEKGAKYIVGPNNLQNEFDDSPIQYIGHEDLQRATSLLAHARWTIDKLKIIGITGTNGKTTTSYLLEYFFEQQGKSVGVLGTIQYRWPGFSMSAPLTTPNIISLYSMLYQMEQAGVEYAVMEVSSHALAQRRVGDIPFSGAVFTNLTQDHLDYHIDLENYFLAKAKLFLDCPKQNKKAAINADDFYGRRLLELLPDAMAFSLEGQFPGHDSLCCKIIKSGITGLQLKMRYKGEEWELKSPLVGAFNAQNLLGTQAIGLQFGFSPQSFQCLSGFKGVCGRLERIENKQDYNIFVDYAHTPDALKNVLNALRKSGFERIITIFGCGGNRDRRKRPIMGRTVAEFSDIVIVTSDNPRNEEPMAIIEDIKPGLTNAAQILIEPDRKKATEKGIELLKKGDALLIAGKGHEDYQIIKGARNHYSDQETVRKILNCV